MGKTHLEGRMDEQMVLTPAPAITPPMKVVQIPIIQERLRDIRQQVMERTNQAKSLVCSPETLRDVKQERSALRAEFERLETQRKEIRKVVLEPYDRFEAVYRECVYNAFASADNELKRKITAVEDGIKKQCEGRLMQYFSELCAVNHLDFVRWEQVGIKVDMTSAQQKTPKKLMEQISDFVRRVSDETSMISRMDNSEEIMVEYQKTLNAADAIGIVQDRHRRIEAQKAAREARKAELAQESEMARRVEALAPPVVQEAPEPVVKCAFTVRATKQQLRKLKEFMNMEGIQYE